jgi:hypothetical protein
VTSGYSTFTAATNATLDGTVRFVGGTQSIAVPAGQTWRVMVVTSRAFNRTDNVSTKVLNVDVGYAATSTATGTGITQSDGSVSASTINTGVTGIALAVTNGNGTPTISPSTLPVTTSAVLTLTGGVSGTTYHLGMVGNVSATGGWSTGKGNLSVLVVNF